MDTVHAAVQSPAKTNDSALFSWKNTSPWRVSQGLFERAATAFSLDTCKVELLTSDPEHAFVVAYFNQKRPPGMCITGVHYLMNPLWSQTFETEVCSLEMEGSIRPIQDGLQAEALKQWDALVGQFAPVLIEIAGRVKSLEFVKLLPLWHLKSIDSRLTRAELVRLSVGKESVALAAPVTPHYMPKVSSCSPASRCTNLIP